MHPSEHFWTLMARCLSGEASEKEREELWKLLQENELLHQQYDLLVRLWHKDEKANKKSEKNIEENRKEVARILRLSGKQFSDDEQISGSVVNIKMPFLKKWMIAASIILVVSASSFWWWTKNIHQVPLLAENAQKIVSTTNGIRTKLILPDGTSVWLNSGSKLEYVNNFSGSLREVKLEGEAYFDVVKNPAKPFIVHTGGINIKVMGTVFDVKSYPSDTTVETTLLRGLVQITRQYDAKQKAVILHPNQKLIVEKITSAQNDFKLPESKISSEKKFSLPYHIAALDTCSGEYSHIETAWVYNRLAFRGDDFETLAPKLERWYNVNIIFEDDGVKKLSFNGSFENETAEQAFIALKAAVPFNFKIQGNEIFVSSSN